MLFNPTKDQVRQFFCSVWQKYNARTPLVGAEIAAADIVGKHPEYHALLADETSALEKEWRPEGGEMNPFLHLSLHLAIHEQVSINQPAGITAVYDRLRARHDAHQAEHILLECLAETIWKAQRNGGGMDAEAYIESIKRRESQT